MRTTRLGVQSVQVVQNVPTVKTKKSMSEFLIAGKRISRTLLDIASKSGFQMKPSFLSFVSLGAGLAVVHPGRDGVKEEDVQGSTPAVSCRKGFKVWFNSVLGKSKGKWRNGKMKLTLESASLIVDKALAKAREAKFRPMCVAVLDDGGHVKVLKREDGASILRPQVAIG